ncbi:FCD domain-containing protein [Lentilitoribacter sp. EG35]|uniref:FCD domain-containing protein n=1 Tax=Lentilitoribacter sp. EG35 TaxID=3234192 RepID=UPI00345F9398
MTKNIFSQISQHKTADQAAEHIEELILEGILRFGDKLPAERDLAEQLDISRPVLRHAIKDLEARELLYTKPGGGTYVADTTGQVFSEPVIELIGRHPKATNDYLEYRKSMEGMSAELAAKRATPSDKKLLAGLADAMRAAHQDENAEQEANLDIELHNAIGECAHNVILLHSLRSCYRLLSGGVIFNREIVHKIKGAREKLFNQHIAIIDAINTNDPVLARAAAETHLDFIITSFNEANQLSEREYISELRLKQRSN